MVGRGSRFLGLGLVVAGLLCAPLFLQVRPRALETIMSYIAYPVLWLQHNLLRPAHALFERRRSVQEMEELVGYYKKERQGLLAEVIALQAQVEYAAQTDELRSFRQRYAHTSAVCAQVLFRQLNDDTHFYYLDAGANRSIKVDMIAVYKNSIVGRVVEVFPYYCKVRLITDCHSKIGACCMQTGACGIVEGINNKEELKLSFANHLDTFTVNDTLISSGEGLIFPRGFALGTIISCNKVGFSYNVRVKPCADLFALTHCYIIQKGGEYYDADLY